MCLNPRRILNPKRKFSQAGGYRMYLTIPCGKCAECQKRKLDEYMVRSYYEAYDCFINGGFILNDTLTYANNHVPYIHDICKVDESLDSMCFRFSDVRLFLVRLRKRLTNLGFDPANNLKYFIAAEYGTSEGHSHRPHYHVLFFVRNIDINPLVFSNLIHECWPYGRTDGLPFKDPSYVLSKRLFSLSSNNDLVHLQNVVSYVTKYMCKDSKFDDKLHRIADTITSTRYGDNYKSNSLALQFRRELLRSICQFHRQSHGFGLSALKYSDYDTIFNSGMISIPSRKDVVKHIPLPMYYQRKLFYELVKDFRGLPCWSLNKEGYRFKLSRVIPSIKFLASTFTSWNANLRSDSAISRADKLLDGRSFYDFAKYLLFYRGCLIPFYEHKSLNTTFAPTLDIWLNLQYTEEHCAYLVNKDIRGLSPCISFNHYTDDRFSNVSLDNLPHDLELRSTSAIYEDEKLPFDFYVPTFYVQYKRPSGIDVSIYTRLRVIDENTYYDFRNFDKLWNLYVSTLVLDSGLKQNAFDLKQHIEDIQKSLKTGYIH